MLSNQPNSDTDQGSILDRIITAQEVSHREHFRPQAVLNELLQRLNERERQVLLRRFGLSGGEPETLDSIGKSFHVTRERIRQIEQLGVRKLKDDKQAQALLEPVRQVVVEVIETEGGIVPTERLLPALAALGEVNGHLINFYLAEMLDDIVAPVGGDGAVLAAGWRLRTATVEALDILVNQAQDIIAGRAAPMPEESLGRALISAGLKTPLGQPLADSRVALWLLEVSLQVRRNTFGEWGLSHWETITPKRMNDKIYLVLKKFGKPLHFREITRLINEAKFDHKVAYPPTVHNELILDQRYVLVGRGIYALREWGFAPGVVADVIASILANHGSPMPREEIVSEVLKQRYVKRGTIHLALTNQQRFIRQPDGRYALAASGPT
jgi:hypothetical protein